MPIIAQNAYYIKLGAGGDWENECLDNGTLRLGYIEVPHDICVENNWEEVKQRVIEAYQCNAAVATNHTRQIKTFYTANQESIFITFAGGQLHWCFPGVEVSALPDRSRSRNAPNGWSHTDVNGCPLTIDRISGHLAMVQMYQGTICRVSNLDYLLRRLNCEELPEVTAARSAEVALTNACIGLMRRLTWRDFELLVDLVFSASGWRRVGVVGGTQGTVDISLILPSTGERAFVQVKSTTNDAQFDEYLRLLEQSPSLGRMFYVWHSGQINPGEHPREQLSNVTLIGPERLAQMVVNAGLTSWLRDKVM